MKAKNRRRKEKHKAHTNTKMEENNFCNERKKIIFLLISFLSQTLSFIVFDNHKMLNRNKRHGNKKGFMALPWKGYIPGYGVMFKAEDTATISLTLFMVCWRRWFFLLCHFCSTFLLGLESFVFFLFVFVFAQFTGDNPLCTKTIKFSLEKSSKLFYLKSVCSRIILVFFKKKFQVDFFLLLAIAEQTLTSMFLVGVIAPYWLKIVVQQVTYSLTGCRIVSYDFAVFN